MERVRVLERGVREDSGRRGVHEERGDVILGTSCRPLTGQVQFFSCDLGEGRAGALAATRAGGWSWWLEEVREVKLRPSDKGWVPVSEPCGKAFLVSDVVCSIISAISRWQEPRTKL